MKGYFPNDNRKLFLNQLKWFTVFMVTGFVIIYLFTFPLDLVVLIAVFLLLNIFKRRAVLKKLGIFRHNREKGVKGFLKSLFQSPTSSSSMYGNNNTPLKYYCMSCGNEHKEIACPKCGSKMKRVG
jgi:hypothetical protein